MLQAHQTVFCQYALLEQSNL